MDKFLEKHNFAKLIWEVKSPNSPISIKEIISVAKNFAPTHTKKNKSWWAYRQSPINFPWIGHSSLSENREERIFHPIKLITLIPNPAGVIF